MREKGHYGKEFLSILLTKDLSMVDKYPQVKDDPAQNFYHVCTNIYIY